MFFMVYINTFLQELKAEGLLAEFQIFKALQDHRLARNKENKHKNVGKGLFQSWNT